MRRVSGYGVGRDNLNVLTKEPILGGYTPLGNQFHRRWLATEYLTTTLLEGGRFWFSSAAVEGPLTASCFGHYRRRAALKNGLPLLVHELETEEAASDPAICGSPSLPLLEPLSHRVLLDDPERVEVRFHAPKAGWVLQAERFARGWGATVNGEAAELVPANFVFRAVRVEGGENDLELAYHAHGFLPVVSLSWFLVLAVPAVSTWRWAHRVRLRGKAGT